MYILGDDGDGERIEWSPGLVETDWTKKTRVTPDLELTKQKTLDKRPSHPGTR